ncbi:MAG: pentapeptide repeat-containing protein, partial [Scytonema sp. PMC 1070.18]|nr:pentapeptide repeat-containing protein [Scytonema sp. PMC 1070.18]
MTCANRKKSSESEVKNRLVVLFKQLFLVGSWFIIILFLTQGHPPKVIIFLYLCWCIFFYIRSEQQRLSKPDKQLLISSQSEISQDTNVEETNCVSELLDKILYLRSEGQDINRVNLILANLSHAQLVGVNLSGIYLSGTNLSNANLCGANLCNVNLSDAQLVSANLSSTNLKNANLSSTHLANANLSHADLQEANLSNANLSHADLQEANLSNAN